MLSSSDTTFVILGHHICHPRTCSEDLRQQPVLLYSRHFKAPRLPRRDSVPPRKDGAGYPRTCLPAEAMAKGSSEDLKANFSL